LPKQVGKSEKNKKTGNAKNTSDLWKWEQTAERRNPTLTSELHEKNPRKKMGSLGGWEGEKNGVHCWWLTGGHGRRNGKKEKNRDDKEGATSECKSQDRYYREGGGF